MHWNWQRNRIRQLGAKEDLCIAGVCDASNKNDVRSVAGEIIMLANNIGSQE